MEDNGMIDPGIDADDTGKLHHKNERTRNCGQKPAHTELIDSKGCPQTSGTHCHVSLGEPPKAASLISQPLTSLAIWKTQVSNFSQGRKIAE
jgi:hypothetical protein